MVGRSSSVPRHCSGCAILSQHKATGMVKAEFQDIPAGLFFKVFPQVILGLSYSTVGGCSSNMSGIVSTWMQHASLVMRASHGQIALTGHTLKRRDLVANAVVLIPVIGELGVTHSGPN